MNSGRYSFRLSSKPAKLLEEEIRKQQVTPSTFIRAIVIDYLEHEETANNLHREIETQLAGLFRVMREENRKFKDEIQNELSAYKSEMHETIVADLKENRGKLGEGIKSLFDATNKLMAQTNSAKTSD